MLENEPAIDRNDDCRIESCSSPTFQKGETRRVQRAREWFPQPPTPFDPQQPTGLELGTYFPYLVLFSEKDLMYLSLASNSLMCNPHKVPGPPPSRQRCTSSLSSRVHLTAFCTQVPGIINIHINDTFTFPYLHGRVTK